MLIWLVSLLIVWCLKLEMWIMFFLFSIIRVFLLYLLWVSLSMKWLVDWLVYSELLMWWSMIVRKLFRFCWVF